MQLPSHGILAPLSATASGAVVVEELTLTGFRSYPSLTLSLDERPVVLTGANGAGKTNLIEAVSLLTPGRGLRGAELKDLVHAQRGPAAADAQFTTAISALVHHDDDVHRLGTGVERSGTRWRRVVRIDGTLVSAYELAHHVRAVWVTPAMDRLFMDGASGRRRFLDRLALGHKPDHAAALVAYERALQERQRLLRDGVTDASWLASLEHAMAEKGVVVAEGRRLVLARLAAAIETGTGSFFPQAVLALDGELEAALAHHSSAVVTTDYRDALASVRRRDAEAGRALNGPHRSDLKVRHALSDRPAHLCSTGEQKALLMTLVLAQARALKKDGPAPLLLFDEVAAHLDETHRAALFDEISALHCQAWLTGTDRALFSSFAARAQHLTVADGRVLSVLG